MQNVARRRFRSAEFKFDFLRLQVRINVYALQIPVRKYCSQVADNYVQKVFVRLFPVDFGFKFYKIVRVGLKHALFCMGAVYISRIMDFIGNRQNLAVVRNRRSGNQFYY